MESACRQMESDCSLHRENKAESETGSTGRRRICDESPLKKAVKIIFPALTVLSKVARQVIRILSSTIHTKFIKPTGRMISWNSSLVDGGINWKNISPSFWMKTVRKLADVSCRITGKPFPTSYWRTSVVNGQTGHTKTVVSPVIRHMVRPVI